MGIPTSSALLLIALTVGIPVATHLQGSSASHVISNTDGNTITASITNAWINGGANNYTDKVSAASTVNKKAHDIGQLAQDLARGYLTHIAAVRMKPRLDSKAVLNLIAKHPSDFVQRKDGSKWSFDTQDALVYLGDKFIDAELPRVWLAGSLLALGDALHDNRYFDRAPVLELVYHLRNGIAHGNRFNINKGGYERLMKYPAHNREASCQHGMIFVIDPALNGQAVLFDFMDAGDVLDLLYSVGIHLKVSIQSAKE